MAEEEGEAVAVAEEEEGAGRRKSNRHRQRPPVFEEGEKQYLTHAERKTMQEKRRQSSGAWRAVKYLLSLLSPRANTVLTAEVQR